MIFTLYYMYATFLQWWRLGSLKNKLNGTLNSKNALLLGDEGVIYETKKKRSFENLLFRNDNRIGATILPKSKINLSSQWVVFPKDVKLFPIFFGRQKICLESPHVYLWIQAVLDSYTKHHSEILQLENFGEPVAWKVTEKFELILKTDMDNLTRIVHCFSQSNCDINHELQILKIETIEVEGKAKRIPFERQYSTESTLRYSHRPVHWGNFVYEVKQLYSKVRDATNPKITIDNGSVKSEELNKKVPVSEVKPIKKEKKHSERHSEDKYTLDVNSGDYRRHKSNHHGKKETERSSERHKNEKPKKEGKEHSSKDEQNLAKDEVRSKNSKTDLEISKEELETKIDLEVLTNESDLNTNGVASHEVKENGSKIENVEEMPELKKTEQESHRKKEHKVEKHGKDHKKDHKRDMRESENYNRGSTSKSGAKETYSRSSSKDKKLIRSQATTDEPDTSSSRIKKLFRSREKSREKSEEKRKDKHKHKTDKREKPVEKKPEKLETKASSSSSNVAEDQLTPSENSGSLANPEMLKKFKPPNVLVYADSLLAKESVKQALKDVLNKEKYTIYDLPISSKTQWSDSTVLVVVCGTVDTKLTSSLMKYLLNGGQLLCLCSDLLYSVLHTFTTAEVREHELVTFSYGKWQNVKMMHSLFCYQASPAKKQFSKDSDASNHSSGNGSSPIAPRTPSAVQIQHNGKDYTIQVQVLGTEETWQTPSLLLASVKGSGGRAVFSQDKRYQEKLQFINGKDPYQLEKDQLTSDFSELPAISKNVIYEFLLMRLSHETQREIKAFKSLDAFAHMACNWIRRIEMAKMDPNFVVVGKVQHSQSITAPPLSPWIIVAPSSEILASHCDCRAGLGEACTHVAALLHALEYAVMHKSEKQSVTDVLCQWIKPSRKGEYSKELTDINFSNPKRLLENPELCKFTKKSKQKIPELTAQDRLDFFGKLHSFGVSVAAMLPVSQFSIRPYENMPKKPATSTIPEEDTPGISSAVPKDSKQNGSERSPDLWCYCRKPDDGSKMVQCDNRWCKIHWFHKRCTGLLKIPRGKWYCKDCEKVVK